MIIKYTALLPNLKNNYSIFVLSGQDPYLLNDAAKLIKKQWLLTEENEQSTLYLDTSSNWDQLINNAYNYSLFTKRTLIDARLDKKTIDAPNKERIKNYLNQPNQECLIILRAPNVPIKQLSWLEDFSNALLVHIQPLTINLMHSWIVSQLQNQSIRFENNVPALIQRLTQGNMLACAQTIDKILLTTPKDTILTQQILLEYLNDESDPQLYELADVCLTAQTEKSIQIVRRLKDNCAEPNLILWILSQEIRQLIRLNSLLAQSISLVTACRQLKIWTQHIKRYELALARLKKDKLFSLLTRCQTIDELLKSSQHKQVWSELENVILEICTSKISNPA